MNKILLFIFFLITCSCGSSHSEDTNKELTSNNNSVFLEYCKINCSLENKIDFLLKFENRDNFSNSYNEISALVSEISLILENNKQFNLDSIFKDDCNCSK